MKFALIAPPDTSLTWYEGNDGHLALKTKLQDLPDLPVFRTLCVQNSNTVMSSSQIVNAIACLAKSSNHISYLLGRPFVMDYRPWKSFKRGNNELRAVTSELGTTPVKVSSVPEAEDDYYLTVDLFTTRKQLDTVCAVTRRLVNLVEWAISMEIKLTSEKKFKWNTFDSISTRKKYVRGVEVTESESESA